MAKKVFISYAGSRSQSEIVLDHAPSPVKPSTGFPKQAITSELIVEEIKEEFDKKRISVVEYQKNIAYMDDIEQFMKKLGGARFVIVIISEKYLHSPFCMHELLLLNEHKDFHERIFPLILDDASYITDRRELPRVKKFWEEATRKFEEELSKLESLYSSWGFLSDLQRYRTIRDKCEELLRGICDKNVGSIESHRKNHFSTILAQLEAIIERSADWVFIANTIKEGKCVLLLGPGIHMGAEEKPISEEIYDVLAKENSEWIESNGYFRDEGLFRFKEPQHHSFFIDALSTQFAVRISRKFYEKLAEIPFHLIITVNPEETLEKTFRSRAQKLGLTPQFYAFETAGACNISKPTVDAPLIYHLFGSFKEENRKSIILTHGDLFDFLGAVQDKSRGLPKVVLDCLKEAKMVIFLGFEFQKWYVQYMLGILKKEKTFGDKRYANASSISEDLVSIFEGQFVVKFIWADSDIFIDKIHAKGCVRTSANLHLEKSH